MQLREYQRIAVNKIEDYIINSNGNPCVIAPTGCHEKGTEILMADGSIKLVEDIKVGDKVMGGDGTPRVVLNLHHGEDMMYRIVPKKGRPFVVNGGHILSLMKTSKIPVYGHDVDNIKVYDYLLQTDGYKASMGIYRMNPTSKRIETTGFSVEEVGVGEYFGFECDDDHLYMMGDFTVTHNSGKSILIATLMSECLTQWPDLRILMLTHQKELIEQDMAKLKAIAPEVDMGVYSASIGIKDAGHTVTFASIQSIAKRTDLYFDFIIVDECHLINNEETGMYRSFLNAMGCMVIGFTATPYRLGQGEIVGEDTIFTDYIETIGINELQQMGYLSRLSTKATMHPLDVSNIGKAMGEYKQRELQETVNVYTTNEAVCKEIAESMRQNGRHHCMVFCTGVDHAREIANVMNTYGVRTVCVEGSMSRQERESMIGEFTSGKAECITNCAVLTTGFDYPSVDCIALLRPTLSPGLYLQMLGRGLRIAEGKENCLVLDFSGNVERHGPISAVKPPKRHEKGNGVPPMKVCPECLEIVSASTMVCPSCGHQFPIHHPMYHLFYGDINGDGTRYHLIDSWTWIRGRGRREPFNERYEVTMRDIDGKEVKEYIVFDPRPSNKARNFAVNKLFRYCSLFGIEFSSFVNPRLQKDDPERIDWDSLSSAIANAGPPAAVFTKPSGSDGRYTEIIGMMTQEELIRDQNMEYEERELLIRNHRQKESS